MPHDRFGSGRSCLLVSTDATPGLAAALARAGFACRAADGEREALLALEGGEFDAVYVAQGLGGAAISALVAAVGQRPGDAPVLVLGGSGSVQEAVDAMQLGAADFPVSWAAHCRHTRSSPWNCSKVFPDPGRTSTLGPLGTVAQPASSRRASTKGVFTIRARSGPRLRSGRRSFAPRRAWRSRSPSPPASPATRAARSRRNPVPSRWVPPRSRA